MSLHTQHTANYQQTLQNKHIHIIIIILYIIIVTCCVQLFQAAVVLFQATNLDSNGSCVEGRGDMVGRSTYIHVQVISLFSLAIITVHQTPILSWSILLCVGYTT